jgi:hypothetical protein
MTLSPRYRIHLLRQFKQKLKVSWFHAEASLVLPVLSLVRLMNQDPSKREIMTDQKPIVMLGGSGFIGTRLADP